MGSAGDGFQNSYRIDTSQRRFIGPGGGGALWVEGVRGARETPVEA